MKTVNINKALEDLLIRFPKFDTLPAEVPVGSVFIFDGSLYFGGANGVPQQVGGGVIPNFISYDVGVLPDSDGAVVGTIGAYFTDSGLWQKLEWDGSEWQEIGEPLISRTNGYKEFNQTNFLDVAIGKDNSNSFYRKVNNNDIDFILPISGDDYTLVKMIKNDNDDYVQIDDVSIVKTSDARVGSFEFDSQSGTFVTAQDPNHYATAVNSTLTYEFTGTGLTFLHLVENRGGIWEFVLDGDESTKVTISTFNSTLAQRFTSVYKNLTRGTYTVVATFKGDDPENPPSSGAGTSRGWYKNNFQSLANIASAGSIKGPFLVLDARSGKAIETTVTNILRGFSNKEFAFLVRQQGSSNARQWLPDHGIGTTFGTVRVSVDGVDISDLPTTANFLPFNVCNYYQDMIGKNTNDDVDLLKIKSSMNVTKYSVDLYQSFEWLENTDIDNGYINMIPMNRLFATDMLDSRGGVHDVTKADGSFNPLGFRDNLLSVAVLSSMSNFKDYVFATSFDNNTDTFLYNRTNYRVFDGKETRFWWEARSTNNLSKLYPQVFISEIIPAGFKHKANMRFTVGKLIDALETLR